MEKKLITTMPIKPQNKTKIGMCLAPILTDVFGDCMSAEKIFSVNVLNTYDYKDDIINRYLKSIKDLGINYDKLYIDKVHNKFLADCINDLINKGIIIEKESKTCRCPCGRVDSLKDGIRLYDDKTLYYEKDGKIFCKLCNEEAEETSEKNLFIHLDENADTSINIFPTKLKKACLGFDKQYKGKDYLITKNRETGYKTTYNGTDYNIDIDALWLNYINCFKNNSQIIIASNHQVFEMYLLNYLNKMYNNKDLHFIATPYLKFKDKNIEQKFENMNQIATKLSLLFSLSWSNSDSLCNPDVMKYLNKLDDKKLNDLYNIVTEKLDESKDIDEQIADFALGNLNFQKTLKKQKLYNKESENAKKIKSSDKESKNVKEIKLSDKKLENTKETKLGDIKSQKQKYTKFDVIESKKSENMINDKNNIKPKLTELEKLEQEQQNLLNKLEKSEKLEKQVDEYINKKENNKEPCLEK